MIDLDLQIQQPTTIRKMIKQGELTGHTSGMAKGYIQANVVILPSAYAYDFLKFCFRNPKTCPLLDVSEKGSKSFPTFGQQADITTEVTFEHALLEAGIPIRHLEEGHNVPMYMTNIPAADSGQFAGNITVSMRPMTIQQAIKATEITSRFKNVHGTPMHIGTPSEIGISNINKPDFGEPVEIKNNEVPVFWGCGVTPQSVALDAKPEIMITHAPGHMFITDIPDSQLSD